MKYKAIIFDMDGTLLNTVDDIYDCVNLYLEKFGYPARSLSELRHGLGGGAKNLIRLMLPEGHTKEEFDAFFAEYLPYYNSHGKDKTAPYPGISNLLHELKSKGIKLGVVSSKPQGGIDELCEYYFKGIFDIAIGDNFQRKLKPAPDGILDTLQAMNISKDEALYVGDSEYDIEAAKNAEMDGVAVTWGFRDKEELIEKDPLFIVDTAEELSDLIFTLKGTVLPYYNQGYNCAEAMVRGGNEYYHLGLHDKDMRMVASFGGGLQCGSVCGAILGANALLSMLYVEDRANKSKDVIQPLCISLMKKFKARYGSPLCKDIYPQSFSPTARCTHTVSSACDILEEIIRDYESRNEK